jgi:DNA-binding transcriptional LysR family regulator
MHVSLQQLRAFASVARYGSFTRAAIALHTSQSALSSRIALRNDEVDFAISSRSSAIANPRDAFARPFYF